MPRETRDVVVLGAGGAGLAVAARAGELGMSVSILEHSARIGGTTRRAVGSIAAATEPMDSPEQHARDILALIDGPTPGDSALLHAYARSAPATLAWLRSLGIQFLNPVLDDGSTAPRLHNALPHGGSYIHALSKRHRDLGGRTHLAFTPERLVQDGGRVVGVLGRRHDGRDVEFHARRAVVLATGDFSAHPGMQKEHLGSAFPPINPDNNGSGFALGVDVGAVMVTPGRAGWAPELRFVAPAGGGLLRSLPPAQLLGRVLKSLADRAPRAVFGATVSAIATTHLAPSPNVQDLGAQLLNDDGRAVRWRAGFDNGLEPGASYTLVFDRVSSLALAESGTYVSTAPGIAYASLADYQRFRKDLCRRCTSAEEVAAHLGAPVDRVVETLAGRPGPFLLIGPARAVQILTDGGLVVDQSLRALNTQGAPIPGLYAVGAVGQSSMVLPGHGNHLGWALTSGRLAAEGLKAQEGHL